MPLEDRGAIIRVNHGKDNPYFPMYRYLAQDKTISFDLRGMMSYLLSQPDGWQVNTKDLIKASPAGRDKVYSLLKEGERHGYMSRRRERVAGGFFQWITDAYEAPFLNPYRDQDEEGNRKSDSKTPTTSGKSGSGSTGSGSTGSGSTGSGSTGSGKAAHIEYTDQDYTDLDYTEGEETEGEDTEGQIDDDGGSSPLSHWWREGVNSSLQNTGSRSLRETMRSYAAEIAEMGSAPDWDGRDQTIAELNDEDLILLVEWLHHVSINYERLVMDGKLDNPVGFILSNLAKHRRPGLTTRQRKELQQHISHYAALEAMP